MKKGDGVVDFKEYQAVSTGLDLDEMIGELCDMRKRLDNLKEAEYEIEKSILELMQNDGAKVRHSTTHSTFIEERGIKYDPSILKELLTEELVGPLDLEGVYTPEHEETVKVYASWNMVKGRKLRDLGNQQKEIIDRARIVGRHMVTINKCKDKGENNNGV
tara:strand:+ start:1080 stop:1562 length:483 start_codon:yes stop_codon:yes gene_type:complete